MYKNGEYSTVGRMTGNGKKGVGNGMVRSMTGYGRGEATADGLSAVVEIRSVNHRFFEFSSRMPRMYGFLDERLKGYLQKEINRGKVEASVQIETERSDSAVTVDFGLAEGYLSALRELAQRYSLREDISVMSLSRLPDVLTVHSAETDEDAVWELVKTATDAALTQFLSMREREGARLREDLSQRGQTILTAVSAVEERSPQTVKEHMDKVTARMRELLDGAAVDEARLLNEAAIYADKIAVAEETVRLRSHIAQMEQLLDAGGAVGRKLDFLVQEMNREANTIGSKCSDLELTRLVLDIKAEIEKIREQIQNLE